NSRTINRPAPTSSSPPTDYAPRLLFDLAWPRCECSVDAALPPPRLIFVPLGFFPELRFSPGRFPAAGPDGLRLCFVIRFRRLICADIFRGTYRANAFGDWTNRSYGRR